MHIACITCCIQQFTCQNYTSRAEVARFAKKIYISFALYCTIQLCNSCCKHCITRIGYIVKGCQTILSDMVKCLRFCKSCHFYVTIFVVVMFLDQICHERKQQNTLTISQAAAKSVQKQEKGRKVSRNSKKQPNPLKLSLAVAKSVEKVIQGPT